MISITTANGDMLFITTTAPPVQESFTGGTGRFADASGTLTTTFTVTEDPSDPTNANRFAISFTQVGALSY